MADSTAWTLVQGVLSRLQAITGGATVTDQGESWVTSADLSGATLGGDPRMGTASAGAVVGLVGIERTIGAVVGQVQSALTVLIYAWSAPAAQTAEDRMEALLQLEADVIAALRAAPYDWGAGLIESPAMTSDIPEGGAELEAMRRAGQPVIRVALRFRWESRLGV